MSVEQISTEVYRQPCSTGAKPAVTSSSEKHRWRP